MRIQVNDGNRRIVIPLPTGLMFNSLTAGIAVRAAAEHGVVMSAAQMRRFFRAVKEYKRTHPEWVLVDVQSADGEAVKIKL